MNMKEVAERFDEAEELIYNWGLYADKYFIEKHDLKGDVDRFEEYAKQAREQAKQDNAAV